MIIYCVICHQHIDFKTTKGYQFKPQVCSSVCFQKLLETYQPQPFLHTKETTVILNTQEDLSMKSHYERIVAATLDRLKINWLYERYIVSLREKKTYRYLYIPDFYLPDFGVFLEVKGIWQKVAYQKVKLLARHYPIFVLFKDDISLISKEVR